MKMTYFLLFALGGCMTTAETNQHRVAGGAVPIFEKLDVNKDGRVSYKEFDAGFADATFATYNLQPDGAVSMAEWNDIERANQDNARGAFAGLDLNHDKKLTRNELDSRSPHRNAVVRRLFTRIDRNGNGSLSLEEARDFGIKRAANQDPANHP